ncbi:MAG TPA: lipid-binding SYLF domain-containing protein [Stellaceae bacterium]|nr:lipid-binding SYLF domain-containing protein [Stellaceae bacterium]
MRRIFLAVLALLLPILPATAWASDQQDVVDGAYVMARTIRNGTGAATNIRELLHRARGILMVPELVKGGFILGAQGGSGVLLVCDPKTNTWSPPAFYTMGAGSVGLQIGVEVSKIALIIMSEKALTAVMQDEFKIGAEAGLAIATLGAGAEASTTAHGGADIYAFAESKGLFGGIALQGGVMKPRPSYNEAYYKPGARLDDIVLHRKYSNAGAKNLQSMLNQVSGSK